MDRASERNFVMTTTVKVNFEISAAFDEAITKARDYAVAGVEVPDGSKYENLLRYALIVIRADVAEHLESVREDPDGDEDGRSKRFSDLIAVIDAGLKEVNEG
jgi:hypothetical protein